MEFVLRPCVPKFRGIGLELDRNEQRITKYEVTSEAQERGRATGPRAKRIQQKCGSVE